MGIMKTQYLINIGRSAAGLGRLAGRRLAVLADFHERDPLSVLDMLATNLGADCRQCLTTS